MILYAIANTLIILLCVCAALMCIGVIIYSFAIHSWAGLIASLLALIICGGGALILLTL